jgi:uncharacterized protein (TIGR04255 family)
MEDYLTTPFDHQTLTEVHLPSNPLVKVLVQMRFPIDTRISTNEGVAPFQSALRSRYPVMRKADQLAFVVGPTPAANVTSVWRLSDVDDSWSVVLGVDFIALETGQYESRDDFVSRWQEALGALEAADLAPAKWDRLGVRYIDQVQRDEFFADMGRYTNRELLGVSGFEFPNGVKIHSTISQAHFQLDEYQLRAAWGIIPPDASLLPGIDPVTQRSWLLDIDVFVETGSVYDAREAVERTRSFAEQVYAYFRWMVKDEFLQLYGGNA